MRKFIKNIKHTTKTVLVLNFKILVSLIFTGVVLGPLLTFSWLINEIFRLVISILLYIRFKSKIQLVTSGADNLWQFRASGNNRIWFIVAFCKDQINLETHRHLYSTRVINHEISKGDKPFAKLRKTLVPKWGYYCFEETEQFHIDNHIRIHPESEGRIITELELLSNILPSLSEDMDESKPQWEEVIIPQFKYDKGEIVTARIFRYHHGYMDGASMLMMWATCMTQGGQDSFPYLLNPLKPIGKTSKMRVFLMYAWCFIMAGWTIIKSLYTRRNIRSRYMVTNGYSGQRIFAWSDKIHVDQLRQIKRYENVSVSTILATSIGTALNQLDSKFPRTDISMAGKRKEVIGMVNAIVPYPDIHPKNHFTVTHLAVPTGYFPYSERISIVAEEMRKLAWDPALLVNFFMFQLCGRFPIPILQMIMKCTGVAISLSNAPMSKSNFSLWDNQVVDTSGWPPLLTNTGIAICTMRYADHLRVCCVSDVAVLSAPELNFFARQVSQEIGVMAEYSRNVYFKRQGERSGSSV